MTDFVYTLTDASSGRVLIASVNGYTDPDGVKYTIQNDDGWESSPPVLNGTGAAPRLDGGIPAKVFYGPRPVVLDGTAWMPPNCSGKTATQARRNIAGMFGSGSRSGSLTVVDDVAGAMATVALVNDGVKTSWLETYRAFIFQVNLICADPRKYSTTVQTQAVTLPQISGGLTYPLTYPLDYHTAVAGGSASITNTGNADTYLKLHLTGPVPNPSIQNPATGDRIDIGITLNAGDTLDIDCNPLAHTVLLNGTADRRGFTNITGDWLVCAAYTTATYLYRADTPTASICTITANSANW